MPHSISLLLLAAAFALSIGSSSVDAGCPYSSVMSSFRSLVNSPLSWLKAPSNTMDHKAIKDSRALAAEVDFKGVKVGEMTAVGEGRMFQNSMRL